MSDPDKILREIVEREFLHLTAPNVWPHISEVLHGGLDAVAPHYKKTGRVR